MPKPCLLWKTRTGPQRRPHLDATRKPVATSEEAKGWAYLTNHAAISSIIMSIASVIDLNTLDNLSRTCRQVRGGLLQYRSTLLSSTLHCSNEKLPVDADETLRYRARATNWFYMEDDGRSNYSGKSGQCARDMVSECRRCGTVVCRVCL